MSALFPRFFCCLLWMMFVACAGKPVTPTQEPLFPPPPEPESVLQVADPEPQEKKVVVPPPPPPLVRKTPAPPPESPEPLTNSLGMTFVWIPAGGFHMGSLPEDPARYDDEIRRKVSLTRGFYLMITEVSQGQWEAVMGKNPAGFRHCGEACPVERVSWEDVRLFIQKLKTLDTTLKYRLPSEAEWEYAARAGSTGAFFSGDCLETDQANYNGEQPLQDCSRGIYRAGPLPVASFPPNAFGLHDMHGNVWEWCQDTYAEYGRGGGEKNPLYQGPGGEKVIRGGSWYGSARSCRSASRGRYAADKGFNSIGFRLAGER